MPALNSRVLSLTSQHLKNTASSLLAKRHQRLSRVILQSVLCSHPLVNAFSSIDLGAHSSIHTATVADIMHTVEQGLIKHLLLCIIDVMTDTQKAAVDSVVSELFSPVGDNRSGDRSKYPRVSFKNGFCSLTMLTADEIVGQLFVISIFLLQTKKGVAAMAPRFSLDFDEKKNAKRTWHQLQVHQTVVALS